MNCDDEEALRSAAAEWAHKMDAVISAKQVEEAAKRECEAARKEADDAKEAMLRLATVGRNKRMRVITLGAVTGNAVVVQWHEGESGKLDNHGGYATAVLLGIDGEPR